MRLTLAVVAVIVLALTASASVPNLMNFQGVLKDGSGNPVADGSYTVTFNMYPTPTGGAVLWTEVQSVSTADGLFSAILGSTNPVPDSVFKDTTRYLGVAVSPDPELVPRQRLVTVGYSFRVNSVDGASGGNITSKVSIGAGHTNTGLDAFVAGAGSQATGDQSAIGGGRLHIASGIWSTIGGGDRNTASNLDATVSGGGLNTASGGGSTVAGGSYNSAAGGSSAVSGGAFDTATADYSTVGGGRNNASTDIYATVGGGQQNRASGAFATIPGGDRNVANNTDATVGGGGLNTASGGGATIAGGTFNSAGGGSSTVGGGSWDTASADYATVGGGRINMASALWATVGGGDRNVASNIDATVGGGGLNTASGAGATISGGGYNLVSGDNATIGGGSFDTVTAEMATVAGGRLNVVTGIAATIGGGDRNRVSGLLATIAGGDRNVASAIDAAVGGGAFNAASGNASTVSGGFGNTASNESATVPGGASNTAAGAFSFAAGYRAKANHRGSFVWADSSVNADLATTAVNQYLIRAAGGVGIGTASPTAALDVNGSVAIGSGTPIQRVLSSTASLNFPSTAIGASSDLTITVTGAADGDVVSLGIPNGSVTTGAHYWGWVSGANTVTVRFTNTDGVAQNPAIGTFRAMISKF